MDEEEGLDTKNWNFLAQTTNEASMLRSIPHVAPAADGTSVLKGESLFMKNRDFPDKASAIPDADTESSAMEFAGHCWIHQRNFPAKNILNSLQGITENPGNMTDEANPVLFIPNQALQNGEVETKPKKKRSEKRSNGSTSKVLKPKQSKKQDSTSANKRSGSTGSAEKHEKKNPEIIIDGTTLDLSCIPTPICSCTGVPRQCYRWGVGGWQSSCCTTTISEHPLPMSSTRPGSRIAGRKMSNGAYGKLLQRLAAEGHDLSISIDLKNHWAKHGTNKFVTIK